MNIPKPSPEVEIERDPEVALSRGAEIGVALQAAQKESRSNVNQAASASGYQRLVQSYNDERRKSYFTNRISGVLVSGASLTPRIQDSGEVEMQSSATYTAKWELSKPEQILSQAAHMAGNPEKRAQAAVLAVNAPMARVFQAANPELTPAFVRQNEQTRVAKEYIAMNAVSPFGDPATGRPVFAQTWMDNGEGGQVPVFGFKNGKGGYLGVIPRVDAEGQRTIDLVEKVDFIPGVTASETRHLIRETDAHLVGSFPVETPEQQRECLDQLEAKGFRPITSAPPHNADLPAKFRGMSEVDATSRAMLKLAEAVREHDVINKGFALFQTGDQSQLKGLGPLEEGLVKDYAAVAGVLRSSCKLGDNAIKSLYTQMSSTMQKLGDLQNTVDTLRRDPSRMDPISEFRVIATELAKKTGRPLESLRRLFDDPEGNYKNSVPPAIHRQYMAADNLRKAVLEQLSKDLTDTLGAWPKKPGEQWKDQATGALLTFPDGSPRVTTPFDKALGRGGAHFDDVRNRYNELLKVCMNTAASYTSVRLLVGSRVQKGVAVSPADASRLATDYVNAQITGKEMNPQEKAFVERTLHGAGPATEYLDETMRLYTHSALVAAHRSSFSPAEVQRALLANAQDHEPWSVGVKSYPVYSYNSVPEPSGPGVYIVPEQEAPQEFNPGSVKQVREIADARTWRVISMVDDGGRPAPDMIENGLSTKDMIDFRLNANQRNLPVYMARKPLPENAPLGIGLAKTFNIPVVNAADPIDGTPGRYAVTGLRVSGQGVATTVAPGFYKAMNYSRASLVGKTENVQFRDEEEFASSLRLTSAKALVERYPLAAEHQATLERMISPQREKGVYIIAMDPAGLEAFKKERSQVIDAICQVRSIQARAEFENKAKTVPPDLRGEMETQMSATISRAEETRSTKRMELDVLSNDLASFMEKNAGKVGYVGFAPSHGLGNAAVRFRTPPMELRFGTSDSIESSKASLNKRGLSVELQAFRIEN